MDPEVLIIYGGVKWSCRPHKLGGRGVATVDGLSLLMVWSPGKRLIRVREHGKYGEPYFDIVLEEKDSPQGMSEWCIGR